MLRQTIFLLLLITCSAVSATDYYYNQTGGDDANDCSTPALACKTVSDMNGKALVGGDTVYFARGSRWRILDDAYSDNDALPVLRNGTGSARVTYTAYGQGPKPEFWGSLNFSNTSMWFTIGGNLWKTYYNIVPDVGNLILNNEAIEGVRVQSVTSVDSQGEWHYNETTNNLTFYSTSNPATFYSSIEIAAKPTTQEMLWNFDNKANIVVSNLSMKYTGTGFLNGENMKNISWLDNDIRFGGGDWQSTTRYGNCLDVQLNASGIEIARNNVSQCYDGALTIEAYSSGGQAVVRDINVHHNIFTYSHYPIEYFSSTSTSTASNISFHHNTLAFAGSQWAYAERYGTGMITTSRVRMSRTPSATTGFNFSQNIIYSTKDYALHMADAAGYWPAPLYMDRNLWYTTGTNLNITFNATNYKNLSTFKAANPTEDVNGLQADPLFVSAAAYNFTPTSSSPACNMDFTGSYVGALPCEEAVVPNITISGNCDSSCNISTPFYNATFTEGTVNYLKSNYTGSAEWTAINGVSFNEMLGGVYSNAAWNLEPNETDTNSVVHNYSDRVEIHSNYTGPTDHGEANWTFYESYFRQMVNCSSTFYQGNYLNNTGSDIQIWNGTTNLSGSALLTDWDSITGISRYTNALMPNYILAITWNESITTDFDYRNNIATIDLGRAVLPASTHLLVYYKVIRKNLSQSGTAQVTQPLAAFKANPLYGDSPTETPTPVIILYYPIRIGALSLSIRSGALRI